MHSTKHCSLTYLFLLIVSGQCQLVLISASFMMSNNVLYSYRIHTPIFHARSRVYNIYNHLSARHVRLENNMKRNYLRTGVKLYASSGLNENSRSYDNYIYTTPPDSKVSHEQVKEVIKTLQLLTGPVTNIKGIGPKTAVSLAKLGLTSPLKLLFHFPVKVIDRSNTIENLSLAQIEDGTYVSITVTVEDYPRGKIPKAITRDKGGNRVDILYFFRGNRGRAASAALSALGPVGSKRLVCGKIKRNMYGGSFQCYDIINPDVIEEIEQQSNKKVIKFEPVYKLTKGVSQKRMSSAIQGALDMAQPLLAILPESIPSKLLIDDLSWPTLSDAISLVHTPLSTNDIGALAPARKRLAFEELCIQQARLGLLRDVSKCSQSYGPIREVNYELRSKWKWQNDSPLMRRCLASIPFSLTESQHQCLDEIYADTVHSKQRMARLLQGDVGCGKTIVAFLAGLGCIDAGFGKVLLILAPTTLLAEQHVQTIQGFVQKMKDCDDPNRMGLTELNIALFTGAVSPKRREELLLRIERSPEKEAFIVIGTHSLLAADIAKRISDNSGLALSIIDEEQRFGVKQREILSNVSRHTLYMSATPIPRTIALGGSISSALVGTLDISSISQRPKSARKVQTSIASEELTDDIIKGVERQIKMGAKCFWIVPAIGEDIENEENEATVIKRHSTLVSALGKSTVTYVHSRMSIEERTEKLRIFADRTSGVDVIVGTTVLEVGIDIPWVTLLIVEGAERFGLSQLHQLRGRVGRALPDSLHSETASLECHFALIASTKTIQADRSKNTAIKRLEILKNTNDGYQIAEEDYKIRGPGDLFGTLQAGSHNLSCASIQYHYGMLSAASKCGRCFLLDASSQHSSHNTQKMTRNSEYRNDVKLGSKREGHIIEHFLQQTSKRPYFSSPFFPDIASGLLLRIGVFLFGATDDKESLHGTMSITETLLALEALRKDETFSNDKKRYLLDQAFLMLAST